MNVLDRINSQINVPVLVETSPLPVGEPAPTSEIIAPDQLKNILMDEITEKPVVEPPPLINGRVFNGVEDFVVWYFNVRDKFPDGQKVALSTLIQARDMVYQGCKCKEAERRKQANSYFKTFWENNQTTDLPPKVLEVGGFQEVSFRVDDVEFVKFSTTPQVI